MAVCAVSLLPSEIGMIEKENESKLGLTVGRGLKSLSRNFENVHVRINV